MNYPVIPRTFFSGDCFDAYRILGAHPCTDPNGAEGWRFAVWAPGATAVEVCGGFDGWERGVPMEKADTGVWSAFIPGLAEGDLYKYRVHGADGSTVMRSDPYAFATELRPGTASKLTKLDFTFDDTAWMERRDKCRNRPLNIYELHVGSWKHKPGATRPDGSDGWYNYEELARELIPWLLEHHFTHVELLPLAEHPFDGSWGYQTTGYFSVTSRYGTPAQFAGFVNACHRMGIGVIMDFVPVHFAANADALAKFDGTHLYEYDSDVGQSEWGTCNFNYYRREVCSFLSSAAGLWMDVYHCDGIRMDAISRALYWQGDPNRGVNQGAVNFLRSLNHGLNERWPTGIYMAEDSTNFLKVTAPTRYEGVGFDYKWDMGWMHDTLDYMKLDPVHRQYHHDKLTFGMLYNYTENFVLPLSHDEVVHGKKSILDRMQGDAWQKFANLRAYYGWMWAFPGKKLLFMGNEFAQGREWNHDASLDWHLLEGGDNWHHGVQRLVRDLNHTYRHHKALHELDFDAYGFEWLVVDDNERSVLIFVRRDKVGNEIIVASNFTPVPRHGYRFGINQPGKWREILNTDSMHYHGSNTGNGGAVHSDEIASHGRQHSLSLTLPPLATIWLVREG